MAIGAGLLIGFAGPPAGGASGRRRSLRPVLAPSSRLRSALLAIVLRATAPAALGAGVGLRVTILDVGQGDSILLQPADGAAILIDAGPPGAEILDELEGHGVDRLAALAITHPDLDHDGEAVELLGGLAVERLLYARAGAATLAAARAVGTQRIRISAGSRYAPAP